MSLHNLPGGARRRVPESVRRRPVSLAAIERSSRTLLPRPSCVRRQTSRTMTTMTTTTAMAAMPMLRVVMGASQGLEHRARRKGARAARPYRVSLLVSPEPRWVQSGSRPRGLVGSYLLEIDREAGSADKEQPRAQPSHAPVAARSTHTIVSTSCAARSPRAGPRAGQADHVAIAAGCRGALASVDGRSAARASSCWRSTSSERNVRVCC